MALTAHPASLSVYRGQSRMGEGEGPGKNVLHGEQYIAVDQRLFRTELLDAIRPWMTLDSDPADHQRLNDQLEAWSLFPAGEYLFVVRLVSAGIYDRRAAYFAHGRAWKHDALPRGFDVGLHIGRSTAFDAPWRDERPPVARREDAPSVARDEQLAAESETAVRFLGHLLQAMVENQPLIVAAPVADFVAGSALHVLIAVARGGLPASLRRECRLRVYSRAPERFLRHLGTNLIVVPEEAASSAITARPAATLIDRQGRKIAGRNLGDRAQEYAATLIERAIAIPEGLPFFSDRVRNLTGNDARTIPVSYNIAFAFAGPADRRAELLRRYLPRAADKLGPGLRWSDLIDPEEWRDFPREALLDELLTDPATLSAGRRELLRASEEGATRLGLRVDERLDGWWDARDSAKLARLVELLAHDPPLVSEAAAAQRTAQIPLDRLARAGSLAAVIQAEAKTGWLTKRTHESEALARAASDAAVFRTLTSAVSRFDPEWARLYIGTAGREELVEAARRWLDDVEFFGDAWRDVPVLLLDRLRSFEPTPATLATAITAAGLRLDPAVSLPACLRLTDLLTRIGESTGSETENVLTAALWKALPRLGDADRETIERIAFDPAWRCVRLDRVDLQALLRLAAIFREDASIDRLCEELDGRMRSQVQATTDALVRSGWWYFWRRRSRLARERSSGAAVLRQSALAWLGSTFWTQDRDAEATLEAWEAVMADLSSFDGSEAALFCGSGSGSRRWPWISPFEEEQFAQLIERASDLGALAELVETSLSSSTVDLSIDAVLARSRFRGDVSRHALAWLVGDRYSIERPPLMLDESSNLCAIAGHRAQQAVSARVQSLAAMFERDLSAALRAAGDPDLWSDPRFLARLADSMNARPTALPYDVVKLIDDRVDGEPEWRPRNVSKALVRSLVNYRLHRAARLLHDELPGELESETIADTVIAALVRNANGDACWRQLAEAIESKRQNGKHAIRALADRIRTKDLSPEDRRQLARSGWHTYETAAQENPALLGTDDATIVQLFALAASMLPAGSLGTAALQVVYAITTPPNRTELWCWQSVIKAMREWKHPGGAPCAEDREDAALALVFAHLEDSEADALCRTLRREKEWSIPLEFGERSS